MNKVLCICMGTASMATSFWLADRRSPILRMFLDSSAMMSLMRNNGNWWRMVVHDFMFSSNGELFFGLVLLYHLRIIERLFGSKKYSSFIIVNSLMTTALQVLGMLIFRNLKVPFGCYSLLFSSLYHYFSRVPALYETRLFNIPMSDKSFVYIIAGQLLLNGGSHSLYAASCGWLSGLLYDYNFFAMKRFRLPATVTDFCSKYIYPLVESQQQQTIPGSQSGRADGDDSAAPVMENIAQPQQQQQPVEPSQANIDTLVAMGFDRAQVEAALRRTNDNVDRALNALL